jgi:DNA polymerase III delta prime subunit
MQIKISEKLARQLGEPIIKRYGLDFRKFQWGEKELYLDIRPLSKEQIETLLQQLETAKDVWGTKQIILDIQTWEKALGDIEGAKPKNVSQFYSLALEYIRQAPGHRLYEKDAARNSWRPYYVSEMEYHPPQRVRGGGVIPDFVDMNLFWTSFGGQRSQRISFHKKDIANKTVPEILHAEGYIIETDALRADYLEVVKRFEYLSSKVGLQCLAVGYGTDDVDGNKKDDDDGRRWWRSSSSTFILDRDGPSRVVVDLFRETDRNARDKDDKFNPYFWTKPAGEEDDEDDDLTKELPEFEIPLHAMMVVFDLRRQLRLKVHVIQLTEYQYDRNLGEKLVLPGAVRSLVDILLEHKGGFKDIIVGKGGGGIILCAGRPGTGKTLTAEVYSEVAARPLYTVQCSQLGVNPEALEDELLKVFARSARWNAILLLDEADVYVHHRGDDLEQNAIVGVFLRTLEYYKGIMFLTTNRADLVDDAILSRCIAKITYEVPSLEDQKKIWRILADTAGVKITNGVIEEIAEAHPKLSGRDVKNLLKLAHLVSLSNEEPITKKSIEFVMRFKPTD